MKSYEQTMAQGAAQYSDVLLALQGTGLAGEFTQTGGMNAAIEVSLEAGYSLLVTDSEDSLSWRRDNHQGWGVGLYQEEAEDGAVCYRSTEAGDVDALLACIEEVLRSR